MKQRIISAIIMAIILIPITIYGGLLFKILSLALGMASTYELLKLRSNLPIIIKIATYIEIAIIILLDYLNLTPYIYHIVSISLLFNLSMLVFINNQEKYNYKDAFYLLGIALFVGFAFRNFIIIRDMGLNIIIYLFTITIMTDSFALFIGKSLGKHKLAPLISPNKTIEGFIGGSIVGAMIGSIVYILFTKTSNPILIVLMTFFLSLIGQLGDLIKSSIKRNEKIKDFSNLIPGHGGIIDRFDSIIFVMMAYILIISFI